MRAILVRLHRWFGLSAALFLFVSGLTGAIISWDHELDAWLNPKLFYAQSTGTPIPPLELARRLEAQDPRIQVRYMALAHEPGHAFTPFLQARVNPATGQLFEPGYNQIALDPVTGASQAQRQWGEISLSRENLLPFLYKLHYSMHLPEVGGFETGVWLMGLIAIAWVIDCFVSLWISFPKFSAWRKSFAFRWKEGGYRLTFDLHRSGGVWLWLVLLMLAVTSVSMNLQFQVMRPIVSAFSTLSPSPFASRTMLPPEKPVIAQISREQAIAIAEKEAQKRGWTDPAGGIFESSEYGVFGVGFFQPGNDHGDGGLGNPWIYIDSQTGALAGDQVPGTGSAGDIFMQAMFPLHSGRIFGLAGRILISLTGLMIAVFCVTGVMIWAKKRRARLKKSSPD